MLFQNRISLFGAWITFLVSALLGSTHGAGGEETTQVNQSIVLQAGPIKISTYAFKKNRAAFEKKTQETISRSPSPEEFIRWKKLFLARQVLIADAQASGYFERTEVLGNLRAMERYMLTQPEGPLYLSLYSTGPVDESRLRTLNGITRREAKIEGIRFDSCEEAETVLGKDFSQADTLGKLRRLRSARQNLRAVYREGDVVWPCEPFADLAEQILSLSPGEWLETQSPTGVRSVIFVHAINDLAGVNLPPITEQLRTTVQEFDKRILREKRRQKILHDAAFEWKEDTVVTLNEHLQGAVNEEGRFREAQFASLRESILGEFVWENRTITITTGDWLQWFNAQLARRLPQTPRDIGHSLGTLVLERFDLKAARAARIDATPRFVEDRANFIRNLVLDLYEKEKLLPDLLVDDSSIRSYYELHQANFRRVLSVNAERLEFSDESSAKGFLAGQMGGNSNWIQAPQPLRQTKLIVSLSEPVKDDNANNFTRGLVAGLPGFTLGPVREQDRVVIMVRGTDHTAEVLPLTKVSAAIHRQLQREALDARELELGHVLEKRYTVRDDTADFLTKN